MMPQQQLCGLLLIFFAPWQVGNSFSPLLFFRTVRLQHSAGGEGSCTGLFARLIVQMVLHGKGLFAGRFHRVRGAVRLND